MIKVSVVIVSYNVRELLHACLDSLQRFHQVGGIEIIVVDNASGDGSAEMIKSKFPDVRLLQNELNEGFPKANNQGFRLATGKYIFMLNPDTEFISPAISDLLAYLDFHPSVSLVAPKLLNSDKTLQLSAWRFPTLFSVFCDLFFLRMFNAKHFYCDKDFDTTFLCDSLSGAALLFKSELLYRTGGLDESMFWIEDIDFCYRLYLNGLDRIYIPTISIIHHSGQSAKKNYNVSISNQIFNKIKYFRKHKSLFEFRVVQLMSFVHVNIKVILFLLLSPFKHIYFLKLKAYLYTYPKVFNPPNGIK